jgi:hypothetical protein
LDRNSWEGLDESYGIFLGTGSLPGLLGIHPMDRWMGAGAEGLDDHLVFGGCGGQKETEILGRCGDCRIRGEMSRTREPKLPGNSFREIEGKGTV